MLSSLQSLIHQGSILPKFLSGTTITVDSVPATLEGATAGGVLWQADHHRFLLAVPEVARYLVEGGQRITIDEAADVDAAATARNLCMAPQAALLYQRGMLAFHAAAVANEQGAIVLAGDSGAGKSTLLMELLQRGWKLLADDLTAAELDADRMVVIRPTDRDVALWPDALEGLGIESDSLPPNDANRKSASPDNRGEPLANYPLRAVYRLGLHKKNGCLLENIEGENWLHFLGTLMYNSQIADALCDRATYLRFMSALSQGVPIRRLRRPREPWSVKELADLIESHDTASPA